MPFKKKNYIILLFLKSCILSEPRWFIVPSLVHGHIGCFQVFTLANHVLPCAMSWHTCVRSTLYTLNVNRLCRWPPNMPVHVHALSSGIRPHLLVIIKLFPFLSIQQIHK